MTNNILNFNFMLHLFADDKNRNELGRKLLVSEFKGLSVLSHKLKKILKICANAMVPISR